MTVHIFVGPTLAGRDVLDILPGAVLHPPVEHGDLLRLACGPGDVVVLVDGFYHQRASVRHKEILALLADGVAVLGCSSMGALRAAELGEYGMLGNGAVYRMYRDGVLEADDEVAVAHTPAPDYRSLTVPLVQVRYAVDVAVGSNALMESEAASIAGVARRIHYTDRSWRALWCAIDATDSLADAGARLRKFVESNPGATDIKAQDALDTLRKIANGELPGNRRCVESWASAGWGNRYFDEWCTEFTSSVVDGIEIGRGAVVRYQQLYRDDFPALWKRFALTCIAGARAPEATLAERALDAAAHRGVDAAAIDQAWRDYWLTEREAVELSDEEALIRVLVRSYAPLRPTHDLLADQPDLVEDDEALRMVAESFVVNAEVASWGGKHSTDHVKQSALSAHLARTWRVGELDRPALLAAARDRGFASVEDAIDAARMFFLHKTFLAARSKRTG